MQHRTWMYPYIHVVLGGLVHLITMILCAVHEESTDDAFTDVGVVVVLVNAQLFVVYVYLYTLKQAGELLLYVTSTTQGTDLDEVLGAPLRAILELFPGVEDIEESKMIASWSKECLLCIVCVHFLVFRPEENSVSD